MILSGKEIEHHNIVTSTMLKKEVTYRPVLTVSKGCSRETSVAHIQAVAGTNAVECSSVYCLCQALSWQHECFTSSVHGCAESSSSSFFDFC
jgi:hypothetical protein